jgi:adenosylcobinamide-phosphate synthase
VMNFVPARITALVLLLAGRNRVVGLRQLPREAGRTASPNSGWPMGALALSLNIRLRKPRTYELNAGGSAPTVGDTAIALRRAEITAWIIAVPLAIGATWFWGIGHA